VKAGAVMQTRGVSLALMLPALAGVFLLQTLDEHSPAWRVTLAGFLFGV